MAQSTITFLVLAGAVVLFVTNHVPVAMDPPMASHAEPDPTVGGS